MLLSEEGKINWERKENLYVIKGNVKWDNYYNEQTKKFGPLLEATVYSDNVPTVEGGTVVDYRQLVHIN